MMKRFEKLWPYPQEIRVEEEFNAPCAIKLTCGVHLPSGLAAELEAAGRLPVKESSEYRIEIKIDHEFPRPEGYRLLMDEAQITLTARSRAGIYYGSQTLLQILNLLRGSSRWPRLTIEDYPSYAKRCFMVDMGRSVFSLSYLKRIVRILARLKMNQLHLHLLDDELCGIRFEGLPFGQENPYAISIDELAELVRYAGRHHVEIVPEIESWGHVGSVVYHRPELRGGEGMYHGSSFLICEETFKLVEQMVEQTAGALPRRGTIHFGLDEAKWFPGPELRADFSPADLVRRYYEILQTVGDRLGKNLTMRLWADHGGRPVPEEIQSNVIIEPWQYWNANPSDMDEAIVRYSGEGKPAWMMGAGQSMAQFRGAFHATRYWCKKAIESPNVQGVNITLWGWNDLDEKLITLFAGAYFAWNPRSPVEFVHSEDYETFDRHVFPVMHWWQTHFPESRPDHIWSDRGPLVYNGYYLWSKDHGRPVAPTVPLANTLYGHDFLNE